MCREMPKYEYKTEPFNHQVIGARTLYTRPYFGVFDEMGLGKSKMLIDTMCALYEQDEINFCLIVCPNTLKSNWGNPDTGELSKHSPDRVKMRVVTKDSQPLANELEASDLYYDGLLVIIVNYEALRNIVTRDILIQFMDTRDGMMILDESTRIKSHVAQQTKAVMQIAYSEYKPRARRFVERAKRRYILTGTPIAKNPLDFWQQFEFLHPMILNCNYTKFKYNHAIMTNQGGFNQITGWRNLSRLNKMVDEYSIRRLKVNCLDLPDKLYMRLEVKLSPDQLRHYHELKEHAMTVINDTAVSATVVVTQLLKLSQVTAGFVNDGEGNPQYIGSDKINALVSVLENDQKTIVYCRFTAEINIVEQHLNNKGIKTRVIAGSVSEKDRYEAVQDFQTDKTVQVIICQVRTGGVGLTLTAATQVVYMTNEYSWEVRAQSEDRAHRAGQTKNVTYVDILATGERGGMTIDHKVLEAVMDKKNLAEIVLRDKENLLAG